MLKVFNKDVEPLTEDVVTCNIVVVGAGRRGWLAVASAITSGKTMLAAFTDVTARILSMDREL